MRARRAAAAVNYNGKAITTEVDRFFTGMTYTDPAAGESDTLRVTLGDKDALWSNAWMPHKGDLLQAAIRVQDWEREGDARTLDCGTFTLDCLRFSAWPQTAELGAVSAPVNGDFKCRARTKTWNKISIKKIANDIAYAAGLALVYDAPEVQIENLEQKEQTDADFLQSLCKDYGVSLKVFAQKLVLFDRTAYKQKDAVATLRAEELLSYDYSTTIAGSYTGGEITYTDPKTEKDVTFTTGAGARILKISSRAESKADAERKLAAALEEANHAMTTLRIKARGNPSLVAGQTVNVVGIGKLSGKYYIDRVTHTLGGSGYTCTYELTLVSARGEAAVLDAIERLAAVGVINTPDYWAAHWKDVLYLDELLLNLSARIRERRSGGQIADVAAALAVLAAEGVINTADYWQANIGAIAYLSDLVIQAANALQGGMV